MSRHLPWLLAACRYWLTEEPRDAPAEDPADWCELASFCYFHDLDPLLHHLAQPARLDLDSRLPGRVRRQWEGAYYRNFVFNTELLDLVASFLSGCAGAGLDARVFKGPVSAARGWLDPTLRIMADVDLICRQEDLPGLAEQARRVGFEAGEQTAAHHLVLRHGTLPGSIELHFQLYDVLRGHQALFRELWSEPHFVELDGRLLPALDPELAAVLDLAHLLQHDLQVSLRQLLDLAATLWRQRRQLDRSRLGRLLTAADLAPERDLVLAMLESLGLPVAEELRVEPRPPLTADLTASVTRRLLAAQELDRGGALAGPHLRDGATATAGYILRRLLPSLSQVQAMTGATSRLKALAGYPSHIAATLRRGGRRWHKGSGIPGSDNRFSVKQSLFDRRRGGSSASDPGAP